MKPTGFLCGPRLYEYNGWFFEFSPYKGPHPLRKDGELRKRVGRKFWKMWARFDKLTDKQKSKHRCGGGCRAL